MKGKRENTAPPRPIKLSIFYQETDVQLGHHQDTSRVNNNLEGFITDVVILIVL